jgi:hypothetical protein
LAKRFTRHSVPSWLDRYAFQIWPHSSPKYSASMTPATVYALTSALIGQSIFARSGEVVSSTHVPADPPVHFLAKRSSTDPLPGVPANSFGVPSLNPFASRTYTVG